MSSSRRGRRQERRCDPAASWSCRVDTDLQAELHCSGGAREVGGSQAGQGPQCARCLQVCCATSLNMGEPSLHLVNITSNLPRNCRKKLPNSKLNLRRLESFDIEDETNDEKPPAPRTLIDNNN